MKKNLRRQGVEPLTPPLRMSKPTLRDSIVTDRLTMSVLPWEMTIHVSRYLDVGSLKRWSITNKGYRGLPSFSIEAQRHFRVAVKGVVQRAEMSTDVWTHGHNYRCEACGFGGEIMMCDFCNVVYHLTCLSPPLFTAPEGLWRCPGCVVDANKAPILGNVAAYFRKSLTVVGGFKATSIVPNLAVYDAGDKYEWSKRSTDAPGDFCGHSTVYDSTKATLIVFGRRGPRPDNDSTPSTRAKASATVFDTAFLFNDRTGEWSRRPLSNPPSPRVDAALCDDGSSVLVSGGYCTDRRKRLDGIFRLDKASDTWSILAPDTIPETEVVVVPPPRAVVVPEMTTTPKKEPPQEEPQNDAAFQDNELRRCSLNLRTRVSASKRFDDEVYVKTPFSKTKKKKVRPKVMTEGMSPRSGHSMTKAGHIYSFGGLTDKGYGREVWRLDGECFEIVKCTGPVPKGRAGHSTAAVGPHVVIFGGVNSREFLNDLSILDTVRRTWSRPHIDGPLPSPRIHASLVVLPPERRTPQTHLLLFGGSRLWGIDAYQPQTASVLDGDLFRLSLHPVEEETFSKG